MYGNNAQELNNYTPQCQFVMTEKALYELGFSKGELDTLQHIVNSGQNVTMQKLQQFGLQYEYAQRIKYLNDIAIGKVIIDTKHDLVKHFKKMFGRHSKIGIDSLYINDEDGKKKVIDRVPRWALIGGIKDEVYSVLNSKQYQPTDRLYRVVECNANRIVIETDKKLLIKYGYPKKIKGVLEILGRDSKTNKVLISLDRKHCKMCNRYIIVASLKRPETHHGMVEVLCMDGTLVYVYAKNLGIGVSVGHQGGASRVLDFGCMPGDIQPKLVKVAGEIYKNVRGVKHYMHAANSEFTLTYTEVKENEISIEE